MSKGYADYLCVLARELDRDFQREADGVEFPLFSNEFEEWLKAEVSERSQNNYLCWLQKADAWICESDRDFWTLLKKAWDASDFETARTLCTEYENLLVEEKAKAEKEGKEKFGASGKEIGNWVSAFRKYIKFHEEQINRAAADKKALAAMIEASRQTANHLFLSFRFIIWGTAKGLSDKTMNTYISDIKRVNKRLFCTKGHDRFHEDLPAYVKARNEEKINEMFAEMVGEISERINAYDEEEMCRKVLMNAHSAICKYAEFIKSIIISE